MHTLFDQERINELNKKEAAENEAARNILKLLKKNKTIAEVVDLLEYSLERVTKVARDNGFATA